MIKSTFGAHPADGRPGALTRRLSGGAPGVGRKSMEGGRRMKKRYPLKCQACGAERWSKTGHPAWCPACHGLMVNDDKVNEEITRLRREWRIAS